MTVLSEIDTVKYFKELRFYNKSIEKPLIYWLNYLFISN